MSKKKEEKSKTEQRLEKIKEKVTALEAIIAKRREKAELKSKIEELKKKLKEVK